MKATICSCWPAKAIRSGLSTITIIAVLLAAHLCEARPHKLRVNDAAEAGQLKAQGARLLADYGSFQLFETDDSATVTTLNLSHVESADESDFIELNTGSLDTRATNVMALRKTLGAFSGKKLHLVQFVGPIKNEWRDALETAGLKVVTYIPQNSYLVQGDADALAKFQSWAGSSAVVQWEGEYADEYKIHPKARTVDALGNPQTPETDLFTVQLLDDADANPATLALIESLQLEPVRQQYHSLQYLNVIVRLPAARLPELAARPELISIQPRKEIHKMDERQDQIMAGNLTGNLPSGPGYLAWLASKGFTQSQFTASGFVVDMSDSGMDNGTASPGHFGLYQSGNPNLPSRVAYNRLEGTANSGSTLQGCDGHGNLNTHIVGGYNDMTTSPHLDSTGYHNGLGVCPFVKLGSSVIFDPSNFTSPNYPNLQSRAYRDGARVSNNSWGADTAGAYDADAQAYDALVRDAQPTGSAVPNTGNQQMVICFAAGNAGSAAQTVGSPGTAKNVIVVGAAENVHSHSTANGGSAANGNDGCSTVDTEADSANDMATFSSRGPCADGRKKPDLVAPGTHITGGVAQSVLTTNGTGTAISCFDGTGICGMPGSGTVGNANNFFPLGQQFYTTSSGTSHSTPAVSGACALLRQFFINNTLTPPSPAMTKAFLVNSARYMTGTGAGDTLPSSSQGMGAVNLGMAFDGVSRVLRDQVSADKFTASGQTRTVSGTVVDSAKPFRVTLAWTDAPGNTAGNAYNNNLDLSVTVNGSTYKGNVFSGGVSITGGTNDTKNNLESVFLLAGVSGSFTVTVTAANLNSDGVPNEAPTVDQDYALVIYNGTESSAPVISSDPQSQSVSPNSAVNFSVTANGAAPLSYQWYFNSNFIGGATNSAFNLVSAQTNNAGNYFVIVTNASGSATSAVATLTVLAAPVILTNPAAQTLFVGATANFTVTAAGAAPLGYQWLFSGTNLIGATNSTYSKIAITTNDAGLYAVIVTNAFGAVTSSPALLTVNSGSATSVVISQIYGSGGNSGATYRNDYVELFNAGGSPANLASWAVQYASGSGTTWTVVNLSGTLAPGAYYLVQLGSGGAVGIALPTPNATGSVNMSSTSGKVALTTNQTALSGSNPVGGVTIADFVGYGSANAFEGTGAAPAGGATTASFRNNGGLTDSGDNSADFTVAAANPRNSGAVATGSIDLAVLISHAGTFTQGDAADTYSLLVTNVGSLATTGLVTVVDTLPGGLTATAMSGTGWTFTLGTLTATRSDALATTAAYPAITLSVSVATNAAASVTNSVTISTGGDTNAANNVASDITPITATSTNTGTGGTFTGVLVGWDVNGQSSFGASPLAPSTNAANITVGGLTRGSGVTTSGTAAARAWGGAGFDATSTAAAVTAGDFVTFSLAPVAGYKVSLSSVSHFDYRRSSSGPTNGVIQYQIGSGSFTSVATNNYSSSASGGAQLAAFDLTGIAALQNVGPGTNINFRIVNNGATSSGGTWYIYDFANTTAADFSLSGTIAPLTLASAAPPVISLLGFTNNQLSFTLTGSVGTNYVIEISTNLSGNFWTPVSTSAAPILFTDPATNGQQFYRGKLLP